MEPLTEKSAKAQDRVTLGKFEVEKIEKWLEQINQSSKGFLSLTKSDVVNFILRCRREEFSSKELSQIRAAHYDLIRHIIWITPQIKEALASGNVSRVAELQEELRGVELSVVSEAMENYSQGVFSNEKVPAKRQKSKLKSKQKSMSENAEEVASPEG